MSRRSTNDQQPEKPKALKAEKEGVVSALSARRRWVMFSYRWEKGKLRHGKWKKVPIDPRTRRACDITKPGVGVSFEEACVAYQTGNYDGLGVILDGEPDPKTGLRLYCLDLDACLTDGPHNLSAEVAEVVARLNSYTEVSPSGTGLHIFFFADLPTLGRRVGNAELYGAGRYIAVTGHRLPGSASEVRNAQDVAHEVCARLKLIEAPRGREPRSDPSPKLSDDEIFNRCRNGPGGEIFCRLYEGGNERYKSDSEADLAFCSRLAFFTQDAYQIKAIWQGSGRWRDKCDTHPDYVQRTIRKAVDTKSAYFDPNFRSGKPGKLTYRDGPTPADESIPPSHPSPTTPPPPPTCVRQPSPPKQSASDNGWVVQLLADLPDEETTWAVPDWIAHKSLTILCGRGEAGKSTCLAWIASHARAAIMLPGHEESLGGMLKTRCRALCPNFKRLHFINSLNIAFPGAEAGIIRDMKACGADMLLIDPLDNYTQDGFSDTDPGHVRKFLEALVKVAHETGAAVVGVRHSAKAADNPLPGSRHWRNVPRRVIELVTVGKPVTKRYLRLEKNSFQLKTPDTYYDLVPLGEKQPSRFVLRGPVSEAEAIVAHAVTDRVEHGKLDDACKMLRRWLANGRVEASWANDQAKKEQISPTTLWLARKRLGVISVQEGGGPSTKHYLVPPEKWPDEEEETNTGGGGGASPPLNG